MVSMAFFNIPFQLLEKLNFICKHTDVSHSFPSRFFVQHVGPRDSVNFETNLLLFFWLLNFFLLFVCF